MRLSVERCVGDEPLWRRGSGHGGKIFIIVDIYNPPVSFGLQLYLILYYGRFPADPPHTCRKDARTAVAGPGSRVINAPRLCPAPVVGRAHRARRGALCVSQHIVAQSLPVRAVRPAHEALPQSFAVGSLRHHRPSIHASSLPSAGAIRRPQRRLQPA